MTTGESDAGAAAERAARQSYGKLIAYLASRTRDVAAAEDALSDAFAAALRDWPLSGVPDAPEAWLLTAARRKLTDAIRRNKTHNASQDHLMLLAEERDAASALPDDRLLLMFACAHPALDDAVRAPLILQTILGFDAATIASAFLTAPATMGQRLVRAKTKIRDAGIPFRRPEHAELASRLDAVLDAIYVAYSEGWSDPAGTDTRLRDLAPDAIWLGRLTATLLPDEPEALGLLALMLHGEARRAARRSAEGGYIALGEQDTSLWNAAMIDEAEALLRRASLRGAIGRFQLEAAVQSAHAHRRMTGRTDWRAIAGLYDLLLEVTGSAVVAVNRAIAIAEIDGPATALAVLDAVAADKRLSGYQPYWAARADLLTRAGHREPAIAAYRRAMGLESDPAVRDFLEQLMSAL